jgi:hypothetical protein
MYSEQLGWKRQARGKRGEITFWYTRIKATIKNFTAYPGCSQRRGDSDRSQTVGSDPRVPA